MQAAPVGLIVAEAVLLTAVAAMAIKQNRNLQAQVDELREQLRHVVVHVDGAQQDVEARLGNTERRLQQLGRVQSAVAMSAPSGGRMMRESVRDSMRDSVRASRMMVDTVEDDGHAPTGGRAGRLPFGEAPRGRAAAGPLSHTHARPTPRDIPSVQEEDDHAPSAMTPRPSLRASSMEDSLPDEEPELDGAGHDGEGDGDEDDVAAELGRRARR